MTSTLSQARTTRRRTAGGLGAAVALTLMIALSGCVPDAEPGATGPSASASASPTSAPSPSPGVVDVDEVDSWTVEETGIGPVQLGMDFDAATATLPGRGWEPGAECDWAAFTNTSDDAVALYLAREFRSESGPVVEVGALWQGDPGTERRAGPRTTDGLGIGSTQADVLGVYPDAVSAESVYDGSVSLIAATDSGSLTFTFADATSTARSVSVRTTADDPSPVCG